MLFYERINFVNKVIRGRAQKGIFKLPDSRNAVRELLNVIPAFIGVGAALRKFERNSRFYKIPLKFSTKHDAWDSAIVLFVLRQMLQKYDHTRQ